MAGDKEKSGVLGKIFVAVVVALLAGGTAPWWWKEFISEKSPANGPEPAREVSPSGYDIELVGAPRFDFLGSGGGVGPPPYRLGRYAFLSDVRVTNKGSQQLFVRSVDVTLLNAAGVFAQGAQNLGSLDRWKIPPGKTHVLELQVRTDILQDQEKFKTRFELPSGQPKPRFEFVLHGSVTFEVLAATNEPETRTIRLERFDVLIQPFGP
jgi:hypothetical protein